MEARVRRFGDLFRCLDGRSSFIRFKDGILCRDAAVDVGADVMDDDESICRERTASDERFSSNDAEDIVQYEIGTQCSIGSLLLEKGYEAKLRLSNRKSIQLFEEIYLVCMTTYCGVTEINMEYITCARHSKGKQAVMN